jgi:hypothetical protein
VAGDQVLGFDVARNQQAGLGGKDVKVAESLKVISGNEQEQKRTALINSFKYVSAWFYEYWKKTVSFTRTIWNIPIDEKMILPASAILFYIAKQVFNLFSWTNLLSREWVGNLGKKAQTMAATALGSVDKLNLPPPRKRSPMAMCNAMWDPYVTVGNFGPTLDPKNRINRTTSRSPDPAMTIPRERTRMQRVCSTVACPANSATDRLEIACRLSVIWCNTYLKKSKLFRFFWF